jgi:hypothetical protein
LHDVATRDENPHVSARADAATEAAVQDVTFCAPLHHPVPTLQMHLVKLLVSFGRMQQSNEGAPHDAAASFVVKLQ